MISSLVFRRRHTGVLFENTTEVHGIIVADSRSDLRHVVVGVIDEVHRIGHTEI